jgi:hypothetical protein
MALLGNAASGNQILAQDVLAQVVASSYLISGTTPSTSANLTLTFAQQEAVVNTGTLAQYVKLSASTATIAASKDTYIDLGYSGTYQGGTANGTLTQVAVANGAAAPAVTANSIRLWKVVTSASAITAVTLLATTLPLPLSQIVVPAVKCTNSVAQAVSNATWTALTFDTNSYDQGTLNGAVQHSTSSNTSRLTCQQAGVYSCWGTIAWQANSTGYRGIAIRLNGTTYETRDVHASVSGTDNDYCSIKAAVKLAVSDYVELMAYQSCGTGINVFSPVQLANDVTPAFGWEQVA